VTYDVEDCKSTFICDDDEFDDLEFKYPKYPVGIEELTEYAKAVCDAGAMLDECLQGMQLVSEPNINIQEKYGFIDFIFTFSGKDVTTTKTVTYLLREKRR
jgi:hypothetical protein